VAPGLFGPWPASALSHGAFSAPALETLLVRSHSSRWPGRDPEATLFSFDTVQRGQARGYPAAAFRRVGDGRAPDPGYWLQVNPVHLRADRDRLLLLASEELALSREEAQRLASLMEDHFAAEGWRLDVALPHRWYLTLDRVPAISTRSLDDVFGRNIEQFLPRGDDALYWHRLLNEIQMLFHASEVNRQREARGQLSVNGIWFSGGGSLPGSELELPFDRLFGDEALTRGLAQVAGIPVHPLPASSEELLAARGSSLVVYDRLWSWLLRGNLGDWREALAVMDGWLDGLLQGLRRKRFDQLLLYPCNGRVFRLDRAAVRRFWLRPRQLGSYLSPG
jgi:hypothetical protein